MAERYAARAGLPGFLTDSMPFGPACKRFPCATLEGPGCRTGEGGSHGPLPDQGHGGHGRGRPGAAALAAILLPWRGSWSNTNVALLLVVAVVAVACLGNRLAGALAALSAAVWFDFFFTLPYDRLTISQSADVTTFGLLLGVGVAVSQLAARARRLKAVTVADAGYFNRIVASAALTQEAARRTTSPSTSAGSSSTCWTWRAAVSSTASCSGSRRAWKRTARSPPATGTTPSTSPGSRKRKSSCARSATDSTSAGSC